MDLQPWLRVTSTWRSRQIPFRDRRVREAAAEVGRELEGQV